MKKIGIKILYRLFAFLSDRTGGFKLFVKYKLILGALLVVSVPMTTSCVECYDPVVPIDDIEEPTCYDPVPTEPYCYIIIDTTQVVPPADTINIVEDPLTDESDEKENH